VLTPEESDGIVVAYNYLESLDNPVNVEFLKKFRAKYGADYPPISDLTMSSYQGMLLWAAGVKKAGTVDRDKMIEALESSISIDEVVHAGNDNRIAGRGCAAHKRGCTNHRCRSALE
jgi:branched-chain amino acid transport system substrate-binding protein